MLIGILRMKKMGNLIRKLIQGISNSCSSIVTTIEEQEKIAEHQSSSVNQTTTTIEQLGASSEQSQQQVKAAVTSAQQALKTTENGNRYVGKTLAEMSELKYKVEEIAKQITSLSEQTNEIGNISQLVSDIANQTNMLALNAAVEAVRAGEHGKGFSVVASEISRKD